MAPAAASFPVLSLDLTGEAAFAQIEFATDSPLEGNGFEISVPRQIGSGFEASVGLGPIDSRRGGTTRAVVGLGKPIVFRRLKEPPLTRRNEGAHAVGGGEASRN